MPAPGLGTRLLGIGEPHTVITAVPQQSAEHGQVHRSGDYQDIPNTGQHEYRYRIIDHGFVVNRQKLFAYPFGNRVQPRTAPSRQNNSFHDYLVYIMLSPKILLEHKARY